MTIFVRAIFYLLEAVSYMLIARILLSWFPKIRESKLYEILFQLTEPLLSPVRKLLSKTKAGNLPIDLSIIVIYILIRIIQILISPYM